MTAAIDDRTVLVVASAPSYAHGVVHPVTEIAAAAAERGAEVLARAPRKVLAAASPL